MAARPVRFDPTPPSRAVQQQRTRASLVEAAFQVFARDGFNGASLDAIASHAGYSKGAVYSNFASKADLFLAVMDGMLADLDDDWDQPSQRLGPEELTGLAEVAFDDPPSPLQVSRGFSLATLEFAAMAGRDEQLTAALRARLGALVDATGRLVGGRRAADDPLDDAQLAFLLTAFDQGFALFALVGWPIEDPDLLHRAVARLLRPTPDETEPTPPSVQPSSTS